MRIRGKEELENIINQENREKQIGLKKKGRGRTKDIY